jgi:hypothetical protein
MEETKVNRHHIVCVTKKMKNIKGVGGTPINVFYILSVSLYCNLTSQRGKISYSQYIFQDLEIVLVRYFVHVSIVSYKYLCHAKYFMVV